MTVWRPWTIGYIAVVVTLELILRLFGVGQ